MKKFVYALFCAFSILGFLSPVLASGTDGLSDPYHPAYTLRGTQIAAPVDLTQAAETLLTDSITTDSIPLKDRFGNTIYNQGGNPFDLKDPSVIEKQVEYDPETGNYIITERIGEDYYRAPTYMSFEEYLDYKAKEQERQYFKELSGVSTGGGGGSRVDPIEKLDIQKSLADRLFGGSEVDIRPQGNIDLTFGVDFQRVQNPILTVRQQRQGGFDFDMNIQMNVTGKIGEKLNLATNYNTQATFDFENQMKLSYDSEAFSDDDIIKNIDAGNVSFPLRSSLIQGSQNLFGFRIDTQWGKLKLSAVASQQKSRRQQLKLEGGTQQQEFEVYADQYDENRHFLLSHYNRSVFEEALSNLPQIKSLFKINPGEIEVWVTNDRNETIEVRDVVAITDLGEPQRITNDNPNFQGPTPPRFVDVLQGLPLPDNRANDIYSALLRDPNIRNLDRAVATLTGPRFNFDQSKDFEKVSARKLSASEYTFHPELGQISLNFNLQPDQVLGVAFRYDYNGQTYQVGEFANDFYSSDTTQPPGIIFLKMLKSTTPRIDLPIWDLMMKNIYSLGAFQVSQEDFRLDIYYEDPKRGDIRFLPESNLEGTPLLRVFNLDRLNVQRDPCPDGIFDFVPGLTIQPRNGRIMFPVLEPFGQDLVENIDDPQLKQKYNYFMLYDSTVTRAREYPDFNRFVIRGTYKSSGGGGNSSGREISLGSFNLPQGSVRVTAGGQTLVEGADYQVDYNIGRVTILRDDLLNSGVPINVSFEDNTLFGFQTKSLIGLRADYGINEDFNIGATYLHLFERPFTQKVNIGDDPINNSIYGVDVNMTKDAPWLTKMVDAIPGLQTKEPSSWSIQAEAALLQPGHAKAINEGRDEDGKKDRGGVVYIDDFEGSTSSIDLRTPTTAWVLASVPQNDRQNNNPLFPESAFIDTTLSGVNRAKLSWYRIDQTVGGAQSNNYSAIIPLTEVFPNQTVQPGFNNTIQSFDLTYMPRERGPYNFDRPVAVGGTDFSAGLTADGFLAQPETRWGGIMRALRTNDFEAANIEYIEFWMLNPFENTDDEGELYINLGNISEDILRDSRKFFENGLPTDNNPNTRVDTTNWSVVPRAQAVVNAFSNTSNTDREKQDVGLDGLDDAGEKVLFSEIFDLYNQHLNDGANKDSILADLSNDNFRYFRDFEPGATIFERYSKFNNPQGNSQSPERDARTVQSSTNIPDSEDINNDNTLNETEAYFQYRIPLKAVDDVNGFALDPEDNPFITDSISGENGRIWYRFRVPLDQHESKVGGIQDFRSVRFIRLYMKGFSQQTTLRFARLELARNQWRRYRRPLTIKGNVGLVPDDGDGTIFDVNAVNIEENSSRVPFGYILPPGIQREQSTNTAFPNILQNEQALLMEVCNLKPEQAKGIYKNINFDLRVYDRLRMFVHAEGESEIPEWDQGDLALFVRLGSDFENNYYEYEIPLTPSSNPGQVPYGLDEYSDIVWPEENNLDLPLDQLRALKLERNNSGAALNSIYEIEDVENPDRTLRITGNPNLGPLKSIMVGVVNRSDREQCADVWINEMRVSGLDERGGVAAIARADFQLADFGDLTLAGEYRGIGYGGLEQKLQQRSREEIIQLDASTNMELGNFLPESGLKLPLYLQYSKNISNPEFDPYDKDIPVKEKMAAADSQAQRDSIRELAQDVSELKSANLTNVRLTRKNGDAKPKPWNIENFSLSGSVTEVDRRDPFIESDKITTYNGAVNYTYTRGAKYIKPFKKIFKKDKYIKLFTEFNFNPLPNSFSFNTIMDREIQVTKYRFTDLDPRFSTFYNKQWTWDRNYDLRWDLSQSLKFNFNASNMAVIDELKEFDEIGMEIPDKVQDEFVWNNIQDGGRTKNYSHSFNVNYTLPFKHIPFLEWITVKAQYRGDYSWSASALDLQEELGNVIQNRQNRQITGDLNFENLYRKSKYLDKINRPGKTSRTKRGGRDGRGKSQELKGADKGDGGGVDGAKQEDNSKDRRRNRRSNPRNDNNQQKEGQDGKPDGDGNRPVGVDGKAADGKNNNSKQAREERKKNRQPSGVERALLRPLMLLRKARLTYAEDFGTVIPGYLPQTNLLGLNSGFEAPGWGFVAGLQPEIATNDFSNDYLNQAAQKGWISGAILQNQQVFQNYTQDIKGRVTIEPFKDFRIELEADKRYSENKSLYFRDTTFQDTDPEPWREIVHTIPREVGSYSISFFSMQTLFDDDIVGLFERFEENRIVISNRLGDGSHAEDGGYAEGLGRIQQDVLIPSFLAAYTDQDPNTVEIDRPYTNVLFNLLPKINWNVTYNGLSKIPMFAEIFQNFSISHGYRSTLTVNSFNSDTRFNEADPDITDQLQSNYYSKFEIPNIVIDEQFAPLLGVKMDFKNDMGIRVDFKKSRNLRMNFTDYRLQEARSEEYVIGFDYRLKNVEFGFLSGGKKKGKQPKADDPQTTGSRPRGNQGNRGGNVPGEMNITFDFSFRDDITYNHDLDQDVLTPTRGLKTIRISPSVDYNVNERVNVRFFFERSRTVPATTASFPITNTQAGLTIRFSLN